MKEGNTGRALVARPVQRELLGASFELYPSGLMVIGKPTEEEYDEAFRRLSIIESAMQWWYGDLADGREKHYGSLAEMADRLEIDYGALAVYQSVAKAYELLTRVKSLTFKHYQIAAPLDDRLEWLKKAEENHWSTRKLEAEIHRWRVSQLALPKGTFTVIYADPPWEYEFSQSESRSIEAHYDPMAVEEICRAPHPADENAILFLWATSPKIREALQVIGEWGFTYRTSMVWVKDKWGMGYYIRGQHELLLIARKGELPPPDEANRVSSVLNLAVAKEENLDKWPLLLPRGEHSAKPLCVYEIIERMYPNQCYIELFAREKRPGWESWGLEVKERGG